MWQLLHNIIAGALCLYILKGSSFLTSSLMSQKQARSATNEAGVMTFVCDFDNCTLEANSASSLKRHKVSHSAPLLHCDFPGCFYETVHISTFKRHSLTHSQAEKEVLHCDIPGCSFETVYVSSLKRHNLTHSQAEKEEDERGQSYFCIACGTGHDFKTRSNLNQHEKTASHKSKIDPEFAAVE